MTPETSMEQLTKHLAGLSLKAVGAPTPFLNAEGASKGCALIPFGNPEDVNAAVTALHGSELAGQKLRARADQGPRRRRQQLNPDQSYVYVGNLDPETTEDEVKDLFAPYGKVAFASINRKRRSERSQAWATVQLSSEEEAQKALGALNNFSFKDKQLAVEHLRSLPRKARVRKDREGRDPNMPTLEEAEPEAADPCVVWVGNLAWTTTNEQLRAVFERQGEVKDVAITRQKRSNQSRGWGTVTFANADAAAAAVGALNGELLEERPIEVQLRRGPRRRRGGRAPREPRETNEETGDRQRRPRPRRQPRNQNDEEPRQRPRRQDAKQAEPSAEEKGQAPRRRRARPPRSDTQRSEENTAPPADQGGDEKNRRRRRPRRKPEGEGAAGGTEEQQERRPRAEKKRTDSCGKSRPTSLRSQFGLGSH